MNAEEIEEQNTYIADYSTLDREVDSNNITFTNCVTELN